MIKQSILLALAAGAAGGAAAHHSAAQFDFGETVLVEGTVTLIEVRNPHIKLVMDVASETGEHKAIEYEGHSRNNVFRRGWREGDIEVGDRITIGIAPLRSGRDDGGYIKSFELGDGKAF